MPYLVLRKELKYAIIPGAKIEDRNEKNDNVVLSVAAREIKNGEKNLEGFLTENLKFLK